jgi:para-nitrobenzyl esterase
MYLFTWAAGPLGSAHGFEIPFVFDNVHPPVMHPSASREALGARMSEAWLAFARHGDPSTPEAPWPAYALPDRATMIFDRGVWAPQTDPYGAERRVWERTSVPLGVRV